MTQEKFKNQLSDRLEKYQQAWPKEWIEELTEIYHESITKQLGARIVNKLWFVYPDRRLGFYDNRNDDFISPAVSDYFNRLLYGSNIFALDFLLQNEKLRKLKFCDVGSGFGLLSAFLKKINVECYNYDDFSQLGGWIIFKYNIPDNPFFSKYEIMPTSPNYPDESSVDILYCADITTDMEKIISCKPRILMLEHWYTELGCKIRHPNRDSAFANLEKDYSIVKDYGPLMRVWEKK